MEKHTRVYTKFFGLGEQDWQRSEISGQHASGGIHHIERRGQGGEDIIMNLIAVTQEEHERAENKRKPYISQDEMQRYHDCFVINYLIKNKHKANLLDKKSYYHYFYLINKINAKRKR